MTDTQLGILLGLGVPVAQSLSYFCSRHVMQQKGRSAITLFAVSHVMMAVAGAAVVLLMPTGGRPPLRDFIGPLLLCEGAYVVGQLMMFDSVRRAESSVVVPFLGVKVFIVALLSTWILHRDLTMTFWIAVVLCMVSVIVLSPMSFARLWAALTERKRAGAQPGSDDTRNQAEAAAQARHRADRSLVIALALILGACVGYAFSDIGIKMLNNALAPMGFRGVVFGAACAYALGGVPAGLIALANRRQITGRMWIEAVPYTVFWIAAVVMLFICIDLADPVTANILQSIRGILIVVLGWGVAKLGWEHVEGQAPRSVWVRRLIGASVLLVAVVMAVWEKVG
jgi:drug/metabolite transporter (DMT)-like permease